MSLPRCEVETNNVQSLPDTPAISSRELKEVFDKTGKDLKDFLNGLIPEIEKADDEVKSIVQGEILGVYKFHMVTNSVIKENEDFTVSEVYEVNSHCLDVFFEGELLILNEHYQERGTGKSNKIRFNFEVPKGSNLVFVVRK